jgi:hypothetical protein
MPIRRKPTLEPERHAVEHDGHTIPYTIRRSAQRKKTVAISLDAAHGVVVTAPLHTPHQEIRAMVAGHGAWILRKTGEQPAPRPQLELRTGTGLPYLGRRLTAELATTTGTRGLFWLEGDTLKVTVPFGMGDDERPVVLRRALERWYRIRTLEAVNELVDQWAPVTGKHPARVFVREQRRRWGSCSGDGSLRFNWRLAMLDPALVEYVVVHELSHLVHPNHSAAFWAHLRQVLPEADARRNALRGVAVNLPL